MKSLLSLATIIVSLLSLLGFLVYWNISNYNNAKSQLQDDLEVQMKLSVSQYNDTLMFQIFKVDLFDSLFDSGITVFFEDDDSLEQRLPERLINNVAVSKEEGEVTLAIATTTSSVISDTINRPHAITRVGKSSDTIRSATSTFSVDKEPIKNLPIVTKKTVELNSTVALEANNGGGVVKILMGDRWERIRSYLDEKLSSEGLPNKYVEVDTSYQVASSELVVRYEGTGPKTVGHTIVFSDFQSYLLKQLVPSAVVSFFLFSIVAISFWLMRRNALEQLKLAHIKNEFIANMTHELKTPISTVGVALESLKRFGGIQDPQKTIEYIDISQRELSRLQLLIDKVLKMSSLEKDIQLVQLERVKMDEVVSDVLHSLKLYLDQHHAQQTITLEGSNFTVDGDPVHLTNVIYNLVDNAVKYCDKNPALKITLKEQLNTVSISIEDNGVGIPAVYKDKVFDRFFRVPKNDIHDSKGHGLGLNYVKSVVQKLGGDIKLATKAGEGSTFTITLPKSMV